MINSRCCHLLTIIAALALIRLLVGEALAAQSYSVANGATVDITEFSTCNRVTNNHGSSSALFVPTNTSPEWTSFYSATVPGVTIGSCAIVFGTSVSDTWPVCTNGSVSSLLHAGSSRLVFGGTFTTVGRCVGPGVPISTSTGTLDIARSALQQVTGGVINAVVSDGAGGWYIGGTFTAVGGTTRNRIAYINADGSLNAWNPNANNTVNALVLSGSTLYAGGSFTNIGGQTRNRLAALSTSTGNATSWNPSVSSGAVSTMALSGTTLYIGGTFAAATVGGQTRTRLAGLDTTINTNNATSLNLAPDNTPQTLALSGNTLYVGGTFTSLTPGSSYNGVRFSTTTGFSSYPLIESPVRAAASDGSGGWFIGTDTDLIHINADGSMDSTWNTNASPNNGITALLRSGSTLYVAGAFTTIGGQSRTRLAALDTTTGNATAWAPTGPDSIIKGMALSGSTLYVGGFFTTIGGQSRNYLAALDTTTGNATAWNPNADGVVSSILLSGTTLYVGGSFNKIGVPTRNYIAALDTTVNTNTALAWNPNADGTVSALALSGTTLYAGGTFTTVGGQTRNNLAALDTSTGNASSWNPNADSTVSALALSGSTLYAAGSFATIGGQTRYGIAALDTSTGNASSWNPNASGGIVTSLTLSGSTLYAGGSFTTVEPHKYLVAVDTTSSTGGAMSDWDANLDGSAYALTISGSTLYIGGDFANAGGSARNRIAALDTTTAAATAWNPNAGSRVSALALSGTTLYAGGTFTTIGGQTRNNLAALDTTTNTNNATAWNPSLDNSGVNALAVSGSTVYAGGSFSSISHITRNNIAAIDTTTGNLTTWDPNASSTVSALALSGTTLYAGGSFTTIGGQSRTRLAALDAATDTSNATAWNPGVANGAVSAMVLSGNTLYIGGTFTTTVGGATRTRIAALDTTTNTNNATAWNPGIANGAVMSMLLSGTTLYVGGSFTTTVGGATRTRLAALDTTTNTNNATAWDPGVAAGQVNALALSGTTLYAGGTFTTTIGGATRTRIAALDTTTNTNNATTWNPGIANGAVNALTLSGTTLYVGGTFTSTFGGSTRTRLGALSTTTDTSNATAFNPIADSTVSVLGLSGTTLYAGGAFATIGSPALPRASFVEIDTGTGVPLW